MLSLNDQFLLHEKCNATSIWRFYRRYQSFCEKYFDGGIGNIQQYLFIFILWSEMKDFARLSEIGLSNI